MGKKLIINWYKYYNLYIKWSRTRVPFFSNRIWEWMGLFLGSFDIYLGADYFLTSEFRRAAWPSNHNRVWRTIALADSSFLAFTCTCRCFLTFPIFFTLDTICKLHRRLRICGLKCVSMRRLVKQSISLSNYTYTDTYTLTIKDTIFESATTLTQASIKIQGLLSFHLADDKPRQQCGNTVRPIKQNSLQFSM